MHPWHPLGSANAVNQCKAKDGKINLKEHNLDQTDRSNNHASILTNPDPSKYVLTKWGDVCVLGKRKILSKESINDDPRVRPFDGIEVVVEAKDTDDTDSDGNQTMEAGVIMTDLINSSSDDEAQLGETAADTQTPVKRRKKENSKQVKSKNVVEALPGTRSMTEDEKKLLLDNPHVHSLVNKLLDEQLKHILPEGKSNHHVKNDKVTTLNGNDK